MLDNEVSQSIWLSSYWFVSREKKYWLVYHGELGNTDFFFDEEQAVSYGDKHKKLYQDVTFTVYSEDHVYKIPILDPKVAPNRIISRRDVSKEILSYVTLKAATKQLTDELLGTWKIVMQEYSFEEVVVKKKIIDDTASQEDLATIKVFIKKAIVKKTTKLTDDQKGLMVLMKEYLDGYVMERDYKIQVSTLYGEKTEKFIPLQHTYEFPNPFEPSSTVRIPNNYTASLRVAIFGDEATDKKYDGLNFWLLQDRQYDLIKRLANRTLFVAPRRSGKSFLLAFLAVREMMKYKNKRAAKFKPSTVIYMWLNEKSLSSVIDYINGMIASFNDESTMFKRDTSSNMLFFREGNRTLGKIMFITKKSDEWGIGNFADLIIIDEAAKIPQRMYDAIQPIITNEGARLICASTLYKDVKKNRFYKLLVELENISDDGDIDEQIYNRRKSPDKFPGLLPKWGVGKRYTIDDLQVISEERKKYIKEEYRKDRRKYLTELYSRYPEDQKVFSYEPFKRQHDELAKKKYANIVIGYDPALTKDKPALVFLAYDQYINKLVAFKEETLPKTNRYTEHVQPIKDHIKSAYNYLEDGGSVYFAMDGSQKATAEIFENNGITVHLRLAFNSWQSIREWAVWNELLVSKNIVVDIASSLTNDGNVLFSEKLVELFKQMDTFVAKTTESWYVKYEASDDATDEDGRTFDDHVSAFIIPVFFFYHKLGLKYKIVKIDEAKRKYGKLTTKELNEQVMKERAEKFVSDKDKRKVALLNNYYQKFNY